MSMLQQAQKGKVSSPVFMALYSMSGIGKSTFASTAPNVIFGDAERSTDNIDTTRVHLDSWSDVINFVRELQTEPHDFKTVCLDTVDKIEIFIHEQVAKDEGKKSIDDIGYGRGYGLALSYWEDLLKELDKLRFNNGMNVILLSHAQVKRFNDPYLNEPYDRYELKLHAKASDLIKESVDLLLFARKDTVIKEERGTGRKKAIDVDERVMHTQLEAAFDAKNRIGLPAKITMDESMGFNVLQEYIDAASGETPEDLYKQCKEAIKRIEEEETRDTMTAYINKHKKDTNTLRLCLERIQSKTKEL